MECAPLCFAHIQRKNYLKFWGSEKPAGFSEPLFHRWGRGEKRQLQRRFLRKRGAVGERLLPLGGAVAQRLRGYGWRSEKSVKAIAPTGAALAFLCFDFFFRFVKGVQPLETGCGTQHPLRALGGTRVLLAAAPTTPPCFRRWRRSSSLLLRGGWSPEVGRGDSEHPSLPLAQRSVPARLRQAESYLAERSEFFLVLFLCKSLHIAKGKFAKKT